MAWIFHFSSLLSRVFDLKDVCLLSNGFKSFGNIFSWSFFMEDWAIYHRDNVSLIWKSQCAFKFLLNWFSVRCLIVGTRSCHVLVRRQTKMSRSHWKTASTRDHREGSSFIDFEHIFCAKFVWKNVLQRFTISRNAHKQKSNVIKIIIRVWLIMQCDEEIRR